jgi:hypothetical protein
VVDYRGLGIIYRHSTHPGNERVRRYRERRTGVKDGD